MPLFCMRRLVKRSYCLRPQCNEREQTGPLQAHHKERKEGVRTEGDKLDFTKMETVNCHFLFHLYLIVVVAEVEEPHPPSWSCVLSFHPPLACVPSPSDWEPRTDKFICRKHRLQFLVPRGVLRNERVCVVCPSRVIVC